MTSDATNDTAGNDALKGASSDPNGADPFHDFSIPQDADLVSSTTPVSSDGDDEGETNDNPVGE